jgi:hypothetical protein
MDRQIKSYFWPHKDSQSTGILKTMTWKDCRHLTEENVQQQSQILYFSRHPLL